jgi:hypothetical protein
MYEILSLSPLSYLVPPTELLLSQERQVSSIPLLSTTVDLIHSLTDPKIHSRLSRIPSWSLLL